MRLTLLPLRDRPVLRALPVLRAGPGPRACPALLALLLLAVAAGAQTKESDPRHGKDPQDIPDPREVTDPREAAKDPYAELEGVELYDALYKGGEVGRLKQQFTEDGWEILGYIDSHCENWLALHERKATDSEEGKQAAAELQAKGRKLAEIADDALQTTRLSTYVNTFYGWTPEQQGKFREGQKLYREGSTLCRDAATVEETLAALTPLQQSLARARELGDTWGQSMTLALLGRVQAENGLFAEAAITMKDAVRIGREIRDYDSVWTGLAVLYETAMAQKLYEPAHEALSDQYLIAQEVRDTKTADAIMRQLVELERAHENRDYEK
jgi:hypothetical protein